MGSCTYCDTGFTMSRSFGFDSTPRGAYVKPHACCQMPKSSWVSTVRFAFKRSTVPSTSWSDCSCRHDTWTASVDTRPSCPASVDARDVGATTLRHSMQKRVPASPLHCHSTLCAPPSCSTMPSSGQSHVTSPVLTRCSGAPARATLPSPQKVSCRKAETHCDIPAAALHNKEERITPTQVQDSSRWSACGSS